jgi:hypothetical protein
MNEARATPKVRRGLWIAGLVVVLIALAGAAHFVVSGAVAGFPIEMISRGRSWIFIAGYLVVGYVGLLLLGLARPRFEPGAPQPLEPVDSTRLVSNSDEGAIDEV